MAVTYDRNSFLVEGKRVFLTSGSIHYFRTPRAYWRDRLAKAKAAGLNTIQFYVAWNWHEYEPDRFDFTGERDLDHFMALAEELDLYLVARPGPYICAEWDFGGFPAWLMQKAGIQLRRYDPIYLKYVDRYMENVLPIIAARQAGRPEREGKPGGVILAQAENELSLVSPDDAALYMRHLTALYRRLGITVPLITCEGGAEGTIECVNAHAPADRFEDYRRRQPDAPLHCTEFWPGWYCTWDRAVEQHPRSAAVVERETWRILAYGGAGYNYYMWHGGTNFGYNTMYLNTTSYDFTAPLSEAGGITDKYLRCRRVALYAQAFTDILTASESGDMEDIERDSTVGANFYQRVSEHGTALFVENPNPERVAIFLYINGISLDLFVPGKSVKPVVYDAALGKEARLALCTAGVLGRWTEGNQTLIVVHGEPGVVNRAIVAVEVNGTSEPPVEGALIAEWRTVEPLSTESGDDADGEIAALLDAEERPTRRFSANRRAADLLQAGPRGILKFTIGFSDTPQEARIHLSDQRIHIVALATEMADKTWIVPNSGQLPELVIGTQFAERSADGALIVARMPGDSPIWRFREGGLHAVDVSPAPGLPEPPAIGSWSFRDGAIESQIDFDDSGAVGMYAPTNRVFLDAQSGYAWYRTTFESADEREAELTFTAFADRILVFLNGEFITSTLPPPEERVGDPSLSLRVPLRKGKNTLAVLTDNLGHVKGEWQFRGRPMAQDKKGLFGDVLLDFTTRLTGWRFLPGLTAERLPDGSADVVFRSESMLKVMGWEWTASAPSTGKRLRWYHATFDLSQEELALPGRELRIALDGLEKGVLWVNGVHLGRYWTIQGQIRYFLPKCWLSTRNEIVLFEEADKSPENVRLVWDEFACVSTWNVLPEA